MVLAEERELERSRFNPDSRWLVHVPHVVDQDQSLLQDRIVEHVREWGK